MSFRIRGLSPEPFSPLFALSDAELTQRRAMRVAVDRPHAFPFRASHAIYVRDGEQRHDSVDQVPDMLRRRLLSLRGYDAAGMLRAADVVDGATVEDGIERLFGDAAVAYLHLHFARQGCYAALVERV